jgi:hypothetical protein
MVMVVLQRRESIRAAPELEAALDKISEKAFETKQFRIMWAYLLDTLLFGWHFS